tara:strand:+ start:6953 stop:7690 length:738 start_codon:yes stop_codon:yes gene_type:complete
MKDYDYSNLAKYYDALEGEGTQEFNKVLIKILRKYKTNSILDIACGTGAQAIYLNKQGYKVTASDYNKEMVNIAQNKYKKIKFQQADMRSSKLGSFDAVISIFNAIGHLSKKDFEKALKNISKNLEPKGIYIFDIFNLDFIKNNFITYEFIDVAKESNGTKFTRFNKNKFNKKQGIMTMNQKTYVQEGMDKPKIYKESWDMQIYSIVQLKQILARNNFEVLEFLTMEGEKFNKDSLFILTIARKK